MKEYLIQFKPFLLFLTKFIVSYLILSILYQTYLDKFDSKNYEVDGVTQLVAEQSKQVLSLFDSDSFIVPNLEEPGVKLYYHGKWVARIIEGCNAISIMILFVSFVFAFAGRVKHMVVFILSGVVIIHVFNILRIVLLSMAIFHYPRTQHLLHGVLFPLFIYGVVFSLWVIWVNKFSLYAKKITK